MKHLPRLAACRLAACLLALLALHTLHPTLLSADDPAAESHRLKLGMQAWTLKAPLTFAETLERTAALGIRYVQAYRGQKIGAGIAGEMLPDMDAATREKVLALCQKHGVTLSSFGVYTPKPGENMETEYRRLFAFAKAMDLRDLAIEPGMGKWPETLPLVAQLVRETGVKAGIHNHPNPNRPGDYMKKLAEINPDGEIGLYADTGHWARSGWEPAASLRETRDRLVGVHLKDLTDHIRKAHDVPWGSGATSAAAQIASLRRQQFDGIVYIEYEHRTPALPAEVAACVDWFNRANTAPLADLDADRVPPKGFTRDPAPLATAKPPPSTSKLWTPPTPIYAPDLANADYKPGAWQNTDGILKGSGLIWTRARYDNFYLSLEFRCQKNADGGLYIRASDTQDHAQNSLEIQIAQGDRPDGNDRALVGALYDCAAPSRQIEIEPGAWYQLLLMARNNDLVIYINDERLVHANLDKWTTPGKNPDGTANQYPKALKTFARSGPIGLHGADGKIEYRNLFIDPLPPPPATPTTPTTTARPTAAATPPAAPAPATQSDGRARAAAAPAARASNEERILAELDQALAKLQELNIITPADAAYYKQNATADRNAKCDSEKVIATVKSIIAKITSRPAAGTDDIIDAMKTRKLVGDPEHWRREFSAKTMKGAHVRSLLIVLARKIK